MHKRILIRYLKAKKLPFYLQKMQIKKIFPEQIEVRNQLQVTEQVRNDD